MCNIMDGNYDASTTDDMKVSDGDKRKPSQPMKACKMSNEVAQGETLVVIDTFDLRTSSDASVEGITK